MSYAVEIENLKKTYRGALEPSLRCITLKVPDGGIFGLLGPNGAGKTTTISILCGLVKQDAGSVRVLGMDSISQIDQIKHKIGIVPQDIALFPSLSGRENLIYFGKLYGLKNDHLMDKINTLLHRFGLEKSADKYISAYSGGMKRRINLIAGILHDPQLLILDEPTVGVDVQSRRMIVDFLQEYASEKVSILYTSHLMREAQELCSRVAVIDHGSIIAEGVPADMIAMHPSCNNLEDLFLTLTGYSARE